MLTENVTLLLEKKNERAVTCVGTSCSRLRMRMGKPINHAVQVVLKSIVIEGSTQ